MDFDSSSDGEDGGDVDGGFRPSSVWILSQTEITARSDEKVKKKKKEIDKMECRHVVGKPLNDRSPFFFLEEYTWSIKRREHYTLKYFRKYFFNMLKYFEMEVYFKKKSH